MHHVVGALVAEQRMRGSTQRSPFRDQAVDVERWGIGCVRHLSISFPWQTRMLPDRRAARYFFTGATTARSGMPRTGSCSRSSVMRRNSASASPAAPTMRSTL